MSRYPDGPGPEPPRTLRGRLARRARKAIEPMAQRLLDWSRTPDGRAWGVEERVGALVEGLRREVVACAGRQDSLGPAIDDNARRAGTSEVRLDRIEGQMEPIRSRLGSLEERAERAYWAREALVDRLNAMDIRELTLLEKLAGLEGLADRVDWGREAIVERLNDSDAREDEVVRRLDKLTRRVDEELPMPLAFEMDALAMGRRLAALEDQVERLTRQLAGASDDSGGPSLVAFPAQDKAAG